MNVYEFKYKVTRGDGIVLIASNTKEDAIEYVKSLSLSTEYWEYTLSTGYWKYNKQLDNLQAKDIIQGFTICNNYLFL